MIEKAGIQKKIVFAFNRICIKFLKEIKNQDSTLRKRIKKNYKVYNKNSDEYIKYFSSKIKVADNLIQNESTDLIKDLINNEEFCQIYFLRGLQIGNLLEIFKNDKNVILSYLITLYLFSYLYNDITDENCDDINSLLHKVLSIVNSINEDENKDDPAYITTLLDDIIDESIKHILLLIYQLKVKMTDDSINYENDIENYADLIENSKIGSIAKDICNNLKDINIDPNSNPEDLISNIFNSSNNIIGSLIEQVSSSLTSKISSGEINQEDLISDAFKLLGDLNSVDANKNSSFITNLMGNVMSSMGSMQGQMNETSSTNEPLQILD